MRATRGEMIACVAGCKAGGDSRCVVGNWEIGTLPTLQDEITKKRTSPRRNPSCRRRLLACVSETLSRKNVSHSRRRLPARNHYFREERRRATRNGPALSGTGCKQKSHGLSHRRLC